jgi:hypothetical protein
MIRAAVPKTVAQCPLVASHQHSPDALRGLHTDVPGGDTLSERIRTLAQEPCRLFICCWSSSVSTNKEKHNTPVENCSTIDSVIDFRDVSAAIVTHGVWSANEGRRDEHVYYYKRTCI